MKEIVLNNKKNVMAALLLTSLLYLAGIGVTIFGGVMIESDVLPLAASIAIFVVGIIWVCIG